MLSLNSHIAPKFQAFSSSIDFYWIKSNTPKNVLKIFFWIGTIGPLVMSWKHKKKAVYVGNCDTLFTSFKAMRQLCTNFTKKNEFRQIEDP